MPSNRLALTGLLLAAAGCSQMPPEPPPPAAPEVVSVAPEHLEEATVAESVDPLAILNQGAWTARDPASAWYLRYRFRDGAYTTAGHPTWEESGRVEVVRVEARRVVLRFVERVFDGRPDEPLEQELVLDEDGEAFVMGGRRFVLEPAVQVAAQTPDGETADSDDD